MENTIEIEAEEVVQQTQAQQIEYKHDEQGNAIYAKHPDGLEVWWTRDEQGRVTSLKDSSGYWMNRELDENGNAVHMKNSEGVEYWATVRPNGDPISYKDNEGYEETYTYNEQGQLIRYANNVDNGEWEEYTYNEAGQSISVKCHDGFESHNEYNEQGQVTRRWTTDGEEETFTYLENGNTIRSNKSPTGEVEEFELGPNGRPVRFKNDEIEEWMTRNEKGHVTNFRNSKGLDVSYVVDDDGSILEEIVNSNPEPQEV